jgi:hypothetical protein
MAGGTKGVPYQKMLTPARELGARLRESPLRFSSHLSGCLPRVASGSAYFALMAKGANGSSLRTMVRVAPPTMRRFSDAVRPRPL